MRLYPCPSAFNFCLAPSHKLDFPTNRVTIVSLELIIGSDNMPLIVIDLCCWPATCFILIIGRYDILATILSGVAGFPSRVAFGPKRILALNLARLIHEDGGSGVASVA
jgi:hypothetical protein